MNVLFQLHPPVGADRKVFSATTTILSAKRLKKQDISSFFVKYRQKHRFISSSLAVLTEEKDPSDFCKTLGVALIL